MRVERGRDVGREGLKEGERNEERKEGEGGLSPPWAGTRSDKVLRGI